MKQHKYRARRTEVDGHMFPSKREAERYATLALLQRAGEIKDLELQPEFPCRVNNVLVTTYKADFSYREVASGEVVIEDSKGMRLPLYKLKRKLVEALYGITIREV